MKITGLTYHHIHFELYEDVEVEAHTWPSFFTNPIHNRLFQIFCLQNTPEDGCGDYASLAFNRVFILQHCYGHFCGHGVGFRQLLDYYFVLKQGVTEKKEKHESMVWINKLGIARFAAALMWVCVRVFGMDRKMCICDPNEEDGRFLLAEVLMTAIWDTRMNVWITRNCKALGRYLHNIKRDWQIMRNAPSFALWELVWGIYQYTWVKITNYRYNR